MATEERPTASLAERLQAAQQRDVDEMAAIVSMTAINGGNANAACQAVMGREYQVTDTVADAIRKAGEHGKD